MELYFKHQEKVEKCDNTCPITFEDLKVTDKTSTVTCITASTDLTDREKGIIDVMGFKIGPDTKPHMNHVVMYDLESINDWIDHNSSDPTTRREYTDLEIERIRLRNELRDYLKIDLSEDELDTLFQKFLNDLWTAIDTDTPFTPNELSNHEYQLLRAKLESLEQLPNFLGVDRDIAKEIINEGNNIKWKFNWFVRPSSFRGSEFAKDEHGDIYPLVQCYVIVLNMECNGNRPVSYLNEQVFSYGHFYSHGKYDANNSLNLIREKGFPCLTDYLQYIFTEKVKKGCDFRKIDVSKVKEFY